MKELVDFHVIDETVKEHEIPNRRMVDVYTRRLVDSCALLRQIDTDSYPLTEYSSGEHKTKLLNNGGRQETDELVSLPIYPRNNMMGLRFGVIFTIDDTRTMLSRWGAREEADRVIKEYSTKLDEGCKGK